MPAFHPGQNEGRECLHALARRTALVLSWQKISKELHDKKSSKNTQTKVEKNG